MTNEEAIKILSSLKPDISYGGRGDCKTFNLMVTEALNKAIDALNEAMYFLSPPSIKPLSGSFTLNWGETTAEHLYQRDDVIYHYHPIQDGDYHLVNLGNS